MQLYNLVLIENYFPALFIVNALIFLHFFLCAVLNLVSLNSFHNLSAFMWSSPIVSSSPWIQYSLQLNRLFLSVYYKFLFKKTATGLCFLCSTPVFFQHSLLLSLPDFSCITIRHRVSVPTTNPFLKFILTFFPLFFASHSPNPHTVWVLKYAHREGERKWVKEIKGAILECVHAYEHVQKTGGH